MAHEPTLPAGLIVWRHPRPQGADGRCIGRTDLPVDRRKAKRLAHRIRQLVRRHGGPRVVFTSPLQRGASVGRWLKAWGWHHRVDHRLSELDFGRWDGQCWDGIGAAAVDAWCADFAQHAPGGGESVAQLLARCGEFLRQPGHGGARCIVGHAGWISAALWLARHPAAEPRAADWPAAVAYGAAVQLAA